MPIKQAVLENCPKLKDGTLNATGFRMLDEEDYRVLFSIKENCTVETMIDDLEPEKTLALYKIKAKEYIKI